MRFGVLIIGALCALTGVWWILQGALGLNPSGAMAHKQEWIWIGGAMLVVGLCVSAASRVIGRKPG